MVQWLNCKRNRHTPAISTLMARPNYVTGHCRHCGRGIRNAGEGCWIARRHRSRRAKIYIL